MKILIYTHSFAPAVGGVETYAMLLAQGLSASGANERSPSFQVRLATLTPTGDFDDSKLSFDVLRRPSFFSLVQAVREADLIHLCGPCLLPQFLGWLLGKPLVIEHHGYQAACPNGLFLYEPQKSVCPGHFMARRYSECLKCNSHNVNWLASLQMLLLTFPRRWLCQRSIANIPVTQHVSNRLALRSSQVIYYGIPDVTAINTASLNNSLSASICFAYVGRLVSEKGLQVLLRAAHLLKNSGGKFRLELIGDGPERDALESLGQELQIDDCLTFVGFLTGELLRAKLRKVAVVIMPSIWEETAGLAAIEQMMAGRLVIASDIGGLGEVVGDTGLKCVPGDAASLANCMKRLLDSPDLIEQMGAAARRRALELFTLPRMVEEHARVYRQLAQSASRKAGPI